MFHFLLLFGLGGAAMSGWQKVLLSDLMNEWIMMVFVEQLLALPGSAKSIIESKIVEAKNRGIQDCWILRFLFKSKVSENKESKGKRQQTADSRNKTYDRREKT